MEHLNRLARLSCIIMMISLSYGQIHNPFYSIFAPRGPDKTPMVAKSKDMPPDPPLEALLFMSTVQHKNSPTKQKSSSPQHESSLQPSAPEAIGKLFASVDSSGNTAALNGQDANQKEMKVQNFPPFFDAHVPQSRTSAGHTQGSEAVQLPKFAEEEEEERIVPGFFGSTIEGKHNKVRRNRNRNNHRKVDRRHVSAYVKAHAAHVHINDNDIVNNHNKTNLPLLNPSLKENQKVHHNSTEETEDESTDNKNGSHVKSNKSIHHHYSKKRLRGSKSTEYGPQRLPKEEKPATGKELTKRKLEHDKHNDWLIPFLSRSRSKRDAYGMKEFSLSDYTYDQTPSSGRTFYYRLPSGRSFRRGKLPHSRLLRTETESETEEHKELPEEAEFIAPSEAEVSKNDDQGVPQPEGHSEKVQKEVPEAPVLHEGVQEFSSDNASLGSVNGSVPRHLLRSPMLVDYGSRVRPQDVVLPTDPPEEPAEAEEEENTEDEEGVDTLLSEPTEPEKSETGTAEGLPEEIPPEEEEEEEEKEEEEVDGEPSLQDVKPEPELPEPETETVHINPAVDGTFPRPEEETIDLTQPEPEAEPEAASPPQPEGEETAEEPEGESEIKPTSEPGAESEDAHPEGITYAEPQPEWEIAKKEWGPSWEVHIYGIGLAYAVLCTYSFVSIIRLWRRKNLLSQGYFIALNCIMFIMGFFRALYFLVDGYNSNGTFTAAGHYFLYSIGFPCLTSAFSILLLALVNTLKMQIISSKIQRTSVLVGIIIGHFTFSITTDVIVGYLYTAKVMMFVCQITTVLWGLFLFTGYIYVFRQLYKAAVWRQNELMRLSLAKIKMDGIAPITKPPRMMLNVAIKVTLSTAIFGLIFALLQTYGIFAVTSIFSEEIPQPWTWLLYNTSLRLIELAMCITMSYVATQPFRYKQSGKMDEHHSSCVNALFYMAPCRRMFECDSASLYGDDLDYTDFPTHGDVIIEQQDGGHGNAEESTPMTASGRAAQAAASAAVAGQSLEKENSKKSHKVVPRPASLLVSENGFIRFREDEESGGSPVLLSTDDELENNSVENMLRNPFYRDLLRRQEKERAVGRATFVNSDGITLQDEFGLAESITDQELIPPPRPTYPIRGSSRGCSHPNTGTNTPGTPRSFCSTDLEYAASEISYRPPSSIHLRDSIENALNIPGFTLKTPDILDSPLTMAYIRTRRGSLLSRGSRPTGSMNDLESLRHYGPVSKYSDSHDTIDYPSERAASPDSMYSYTLSNLTRAPLVRSYSDSIGRTSLAEASIPNSPERQYYKARVQASMLKNNPENSNQFQNLLRNINDMCNAYNKLSPDDREGDE